VDQTQTSELGHHHVFLAAEHEANERRTWGVIILCGLMMVGEIVGGSLFGSIALVADGLHMSTHAGALLLAALAYTFSRKHARDPRFSFGTGKLGDLAGFTSAIVLAMIALLIGYEAALRFFRPVAIHFGEAIPIAVLGLGVNIASAWQLTAGGHDHHHGHGHGHDHAHGHDHDHGDEHQDVVTKLGALSLSIFEEGVPPRFRLRRDDGAPLEPQDIELETVREGGGRMRFSFLSFGDYLESEEEIPEPHAFAAELTVAGERHALVFEEHARGAHDRDNNMRAAVVHVMADAAVSALVIAGLVLARLFGWLWMDPLAGIVGACVIASWSYALIRDTGAILLDMNPDRNLSDTIRKTVEAQGDQVCDLHLWRVGPGHLAAIVEVATDTPRQADFYKQRLGRLPSLSHVTVEVQRIAA
jgi:cation diffusion facilitator family transporter